MTKAQAIIMGALGFFMGCAPLSAHADDLNELMMVDKCQTIRCFNDFNDRFNARLVEHNRQVLQLNEQIRALNERTDALDREGAAIARAQAVYERVRARFTGGNM
jgi:hypothetical protein